MNYVSNPTLTLTVVPKEIVYNVWPQVVKTMSKSVETSGGKFLMQDILRGIEHDIYVLWVVLDHQAAPGQDQVIASLTTRIIGYPNKRALALDWIGGKRMKEWLPIAQDTMQRYAKDNGCTHLEGYGRKAWGRWLQKYGWEPDYIAYRMELSDG